MPDPADSYSRIEREHLIGSLQSLRQKMRQMLLAYGLGIGVACAVGALLATVLLDWMLNLPAVPRICVGLLALGALGYALWRQLILPLSAKRSISDIAGRLEGVFPVFDDRLRSTVDFVKAQIPGSEIMKERVVHEAAHLAHQVDLKSALVYRPVRRSWYGAAAALWVLIALGWLLPTSSLRSIALSRLLHPFGSAQWPKRVQIDAPPLPNLVPLGQRIAISIHLVDPKTKLDKPAMEARVYYQSDQGAEEHDIMARNDDGTYSASLDAKGSLLKVWFAAGDDQTPPSVIHVVPRLEIQHVDLDILPPRYVHAAKVQSVNLSGGPAIAVAGSTLALRVQFSKPLDPKTPVHIEAAAPEFAGKMPVLAWTSDAPGRCVGRFIARESIRFHIQAKDLDGFTNKGLEEYELAVRLDQLPSVVIENPRSDGEYTPQATVPMRIVAEDDFGIDKMTLVVERDATGATTQPSATTNHWEIPLQGWQSIDSTGDRVHFRLDYPWVLSSLPGADLKPGEVLHYWMTVNDNYDLEDPAHPAGPHLTHPAVPSGKLRITLISQEQLAEQAQQVFLSVYKKVEEVLKNQNNLRVQNAQLKEESKDKREFDAGDRNNAERILNQQSAAASHTRQMSETLDQLEHRLNENKSDAKDLMGLAHEVKAELSHTAENPMKEAVNQVSSAKDQKPSPQDSEAQQKAATERRNQSLDQSGANMQQASEQLQHVMDRLGNVGGSLAAEIAKLQKELDEQNKVNQETKDFQKEHLGQKPEDMSKEDREKLNNIVSQQNQLPKETDKNVADLDKAANQTKKSDPSASEAFQKASEQAKSQGISSSQQQAGQQMQQNQQSASQSSQQQASLGLETVLATLRAEQQRQLEKLVAQLDDAVEALTRLVQRQAGHNFDNLTLQKKPIDDVLRKEAEKFVSAEHLKPELPLLTSSQEMTEQNTRDVSSKISDLPDTTAIVSLLTLAAQKMVYAITSLRDDKLPPEQRLASAYDPHQTGALAALKEALAALQKMRDQAQNKADAAKEEAIRQAYIKVRQDQRDKLNKPTTDIDAAPRLADGSLKREQDWLLKKLPPIQQELSDKCKELGQRLQALQAVEFSSANDEVISTMGRIGTELTNRHTGKSTQVQEAAVDEELTAIIDALKISEDQKEFAESNGGGGGGGGGGLPPMPSEAELRLMKAMQNIFNRETKVADADKDRNPSVTADLSQRQNTLRNNLDVILKKTGYQQGVGPEPDPSDIKKLPEMASDEQLDNQELNNQLLGGHADEDEVGKGFEKVGDRMSYVKVLLADNKPGQTTQKIEQRIVANLDELIDLAKKSNAQSKSGSSKGEQAQKPGEKPSEQANNQANQNQPGQPKPNNSSTPAGKESFSKANENNATLGDEKKLVESNWGQSSPRIHDAIIEGESEHVIDKFDKLVRGYYREMAKDSNQNPDH